MLLKLEMMVFYEDHGVSVDELESQLKRAVDFLYEEGLLSGNNEAQVEWYSLRVRELEGYRDSDRLSPEEIALEFQRQFSEGVNKGEK